MQVSLKELRETLIWLRFAHRLGGQKVAIGRLAKECNELIAVFVQSINTVKGSTVRP
jgi:four helix bundle protein